MSRWADPQVASYNQTTMEFAGTTVFLFPFAGGTKYSYKHFHEHKPSFLNFITLEYPGRGGRANEPLLTDVESLIEDLYRQVSVNIKEGPYAFYGHSLGALLAFLLARRIRKGGCGEPKHLFLTGCSGPAHVSRSDKSRHLMSKADFMKEIRELNGSPEEVMENAELFEYFEPILRADFQASETYMYQGDDPLDISFTVITGKEEAIEAEAIRMWQVETNGRVDFKVMPGNHFFISTYYREIVNIISRKLFPLNIKS